LAWYTIHTNAEAVLRLTIIRVVIARKSYGDSERDLGERGTTCELPFTHHRLNLLGTRMPNNNNCPSCGESKIKSHRNINAGWIIFFIFTMGLGLLLLPFISKTYECKACSHKWKHDDSNSKAFLRNILSFIKTPTFSWLSSILGIFVSFSVISANFICGILMLISCLAILPPIRKLYSKRINIRRKFVAIGSFFLFILCFSAYNQTLPKIQVTTSGLPSNATVKRIFPLDTTLTSEDINQRLTYWCVKVQAVKINDQSLSEEDIEKLCEGGYSLRLKDGENTFNIELISGKDSIKETFLISFDKNVYDEKKKAQTLAEAQASVQRSLNEYASKYGISSNLAQKLLDIFPKVGMEKDKVTSIQKSDNWAKGERYSITYDGNQVMAYLNKDGSVSSLNYGDVKLYQASGESHPISNYLLSSDEISQLKIWSEDSVKSVLKAPSTAEFPGGFFDPYTDWGFSKDGNTYKVSSYVDSQNSFGAMIRSEFYIEYKWNKGEDGVIKSFILDGEKIK